MLRTQVAVLMVCVGLAGFVGRQTAAADVVGIPLKPDPPFAVDGDLGEWTDVPNKMTLNLAEQVIWGAANWETPADLSGIVHVGWRREHLYVAVNVADDALRQTQHGNGIWKGDHVEVFLDVQPELEPKRDSFGEGQFHLGLSPGNFMKTGDPLADCTPEAFCFRPVGLAAEGVLVASAETDVGWTLEAAIPWQLLGVDEAASGMLLRFEIAISDTDTNEPQQESMMTTSSAVWAHKRSRLTLASLAGADGVAKAAAREVPVFDELELERGGKRSFVFEVAEIPEGRDAVLTLRARLHSGKVAGYHQAMRLTLNGQTFDAARLINRPLHVKARDGRAFSMAAGERFSTFYAPDFKSPDTHPRYGLLDGVKACDFEFNVTDLVHTGDNILLVENAAAEIVDNPMHVADAAVAFRMPPPPPKPKAGPPTGPLDKIEPRAKVATPYAVKELDGATIVLEVGGGTFVIGSRFSTPDGVWTHGSCRYFKHERRIEQRAEAVIVRDTFTNATGDNLPLMHRHEAAFEDAIEGLWLGGLEQYGGTGSTAVSANSTTYAATNECGIGFVALDDAFRVHVNNYAVDGHAGLGDNSLVLKPESSYTAEWAIIPTEVAGYWRFINVARRLVGANFLIGGCFVFLRAAPLTDVWTDAQIADFIRFKDGNYICASISYPRYKGHYSHGTAFQRITHDNYRNSFERWRRLAPDIETLVYFHCFLDVTEEAPERFADARTLRPDGAQANYGKPHQRVFFPTSSNSFGPEIAKNVDIILDEIKADGYADNAVAAVDIAHKLVGHG